jgi:hypothetical protein
MSSWQLYPSVIAAEYGKGEQFGDSATLDLAT